MEPDLTEDLSLRYQRWSYVSYGLAQLGVFSVIDVQEIGRLDCKCINEDNRICACVGHDSDFEQNLMKDNDHFLYSKYGC